MDIFKLIELVLGAGGITEQSKFDEEARQLGIERYDEAEALSVGLRGRVLPNIERLGSEQMKMLEGSGVQQKKDVSRRAKTRLAGVQSNIQRRGLGNTTVGASMAKGFGEYEEDQLARIDEQVRQERMQTHGYWGLLGETMDVDLTGQQIGIKAGYAIPPQQSPLLAYSELSGRMVRPPEPPEPPGTDWGATAVTSGVALKGAGIMAGPAAAPLLSMCIDGDAIVVMPDKTRRLKDIKVGDKVLNSRGEFVEVVWRDYGYPAEVNEYVELSCGASRLIATTDHHIGGKPAGEWRSGEEMQFYNKKRLIEGVQKVHWVLCGDIRLADDSDYIANGFVVTSQLARASAAWAGEPEGTSNASSIHTTRPG